MDENSKNGLAVLSLVSSVIGWFMLGIVFEPTAIICGIMAMSAKNTAYKACGCIGLITGCIGTTVVLLWFMVALSR